MRNITTIILGGVSLVLAIVMTAVEQNPQGSTLRGQLVRFEENHVQSITLMRGGQSVVMERLQGFWFFTSPDQDRINVNSMKSLLDTLNHLTILDRLESSELVGEMSLANLGMVGDEALQVLIKSKIKGKTKTDKLVIGRASPRANSVFASLAKGKESGDVVVVDGNPHDILDSPYETLLERQLVNLPPNAILQLAVQTSGSGVVLQRQVTAQRSSPWMLSQPIAAKADQAKVDDLIASILALQIVDVDSSDSAPIEIPSPMPEDAALLQFSVLGMQKPLVVYLEKEKQPADDFAPRYLIARASDRPSKYRINSPFLNSLLSSAGSLRDRRLGKVPEQALEKIAIIGRRPSTEVLLEAERSAQGVKWVVETNGQYPDANYPRIKSLISQMDEPVIIDFVKDGDLKSYGMGSDQPGAMLLAFEFKLPGEVKADGTVGPEESFTRKLRLGWLEGENRRLFGNFIGEPHIYELDPKFASLLYTHPIKWKSLNVNSYPSFRTKKITKQVRGQSDIILEYDNVRSQWTASRNDGEDVSSILDPASADKLRDRLSSLKATGWNLNSRLGYKLLETPFAIFTIETEEYNKETKAMGLVTRVLKLVEANGFIYGRIGDSPDLFFIDPTKFRELIKPLTSFSAE